MELEDPPRVVDWSMLFVAIKQPILLVFSSVLFELVIFVLREALSFISLFAYAEVGLCAYARCVLCLGIYSCVDFDCNCRNGGESKSFPLSGDEVN